MVKQDATPNQISALEYYRVQTNELYFQGKTDLKFLINAWEKLDVKKYPMAKAVRKMVLDEWKKRPELHGRHANPAIFREHADFLGLAISIKYSLDMQVDPKGMFALLTPMTMDTIWATPAMSELDGSRE